LPATGRAMAAVKAMSRFLNHHKVTLPALIEPVQEAVRVALADAPAGVVLVVHDWCMFCFQTHTGKTDTYQRSHELDCGYDLGTALVVRGDNGCPLGVMELRLHTRNEILSTRPGGVSAPPGHVDELAGVMDDSRRWNLGRPVVHIIDREADSIGHYRAWHAAGHTFVVRAKTDRRVTWRDQSITLKDLQAKLANDFRDPPTDPLQVKTAKHGRCRVQVLETEVLLDRPARTRTGGGTQRQVAGTPLTLRLVLTRVIDALGVVRAEWLLFTNAGTASDATSIARWYTWRWRIESCHKLLKTAGMNAEEWQQESGDAFAKRLAIASMACLTVWHLQQDESEEAAQMKGLLVRLSGRQMKHRVTDTAPALLAGLEKLLAMLDLLETHKLEEIHALTRRLFPRFFNSA
jgi:hypothetical protein